MTPVVYQVSEVYLTVQGEGRFSGDVMALVRLQGCGVGCPWCDTRHSWTKEPRAEDAPPLSADHAHWARGPLTAFQIVAAVLDAAAGRPVATVLVTGGEPAEQDLTDLARAVKLQQWRLNLETSGTADGHLATRPLWDWVCVSPKDRMPGGKPILAEVLRAADELKFVVGKESHVEAAIELMKQHLTSDARPVVSLQPLSANSKATEICVTRAMRHGFRVSMQQHKFLNVP